MGKDPIVLGAVHTQKKKMVPAQRAYKLSIKLEIDGYTQTGECIRPHFACPISNMYSHETNIERCLSLALYIVNKYCDTKTVWCSERTMEQDQKCCTGDRAAIHQLWKIFGYVSELRTLALYVRIR